MSGSGFRKSQTAHGTWTSARGGEVPEDGAVERIHGPAFASHRLLLPPMVWLIQSAWATTLV